MPDVAPAIRVTESLLHGLQRQGTRPRDLASCAVALRVVLAR